MSAPAASSPTLPPIVHLARVIERVAFHNEENGFCVLRLEARGQRDFVTVIGHAAMVSAREFIQATGTWISFGSYSGLAPSGHLMKGLS